MYVQKFDPSNPDRMVILSAQADVWVKRQVLLFLLQR